MVEILIIFKLGLGSFLSIVSVIVRNRTVAMFFAILIVILLSSFYGFREVVIFSQDGRYTDAYTYVQYFDQLRDFASLVEGELAWKGDYLFFIIPAILRQLEADSHVILALYSVFAILLFVYGLYRILSSLGISLIYLPLLVVLSASTSTFVAVYGNLLRQGLAISLIVLAITYFLESKKKYAWLLLLTSIFIHKSALVVIMVCFIVFELNKGKPLHYIGFVIFAYLIGIIGGLLSFESLNIPFVSDRLFLYKGSESNVLQFKLWPLVFMGGGLFWLNRKPHIPAFTKLLYVYALLIAAALATAEYEIMSKRLLYYPSILTPIFFVYLIKYVPFSRAYILLLHVAPLGYVAVLIQYSRTLDIIKF